MKGIKRMPRKMVIQDREFESDFDVEVKKVMRRKGRKDRKTIK